jgi:hypothetical protein
MSFTRSPERIFSRTLFKKISIISFARTFIKFHYKMIRKMDIYIGCGWPYRKFAREIMTKTENLGFRLTHDWTCMETETRTPEDQAKNARLDVSGVKNADIVVILFPDHEYKYTGTFSEMMMAHVLGKKIVIYNPTHDTDFKNVEGPAKNVFYYLEDVTYVNNIDDLILFLKEYSKEFLYFYC